MNSKKKQKSVYLISGIPASGKSTYIRNNLISSDKDVHISRDMIRFSLLNEDDNYFDKETKLKGYFILANEKYLKEYYQVLGYIIRIEDTGFSAVIEISWTEE